MLAFLIIWLQEVLNILNRSSILRVNKMDTQCKKKKKLFYSNTYQRKSSLKQSQAYQCNHWCHTERAEKPAWKIQTTVKKNIIQHWLANNFTFSYATNVPWKETPNLAVSHDNLYAWGYNKSSLNSLHRLYKSLQTNHMGRSLSITPSKWESSISEKEIKSTDSSGIVSWHWWDTTLTVAQLWIPWVWKY